MIWMQIWIDSMKHSADGFGSVELRGGTAVERFAIPGAGAIIETVINGVDHILVQERCKLDAPSETGLIEIPAGKIRAFENVYDCLRREIWEETGLRVIEIGGESGCSWTECDGYRVINFSPFSCAQNTVGDYPILVMVFICRVDGQSTDSDEAKNARWITLDELRSLIEMAGGKRLYPMHIATLQKYLASKGFC